jgi:hypothetical protein
MVPTLIRVDPGGYLETQWSGTVFDSREMPVDCYVDLNTASASCRQRVGAPAGEYAFATSAGTSATCDGKSCDCTPGPSGSCEVPSGGQIGGSTLKATAKLVLPADTLVELEIQ